MNNSKGIVRVLLIVAVGASLIALLFDLRRKHQAANVAVQDIEDRLAELDPVTRAAVLAKLSTDAAEHERASRDAKD